MTFFVLSKIFKQLNKRLFTLLVIGTLIFKANGQSYNTTFGFRLGEQLGFNITQRVVNHTTVDLNLSNGLFSNKKFVNFNVRQHYPVITRRFNFYLGAGVFSESFIQDANYDAVDFNFDRSGVSGVLGAEVTFGRLNLSIDYMPKYIVKNKSAVNSLQADSAFSIKYVLWKRKGWLKKMWEKIF